MKGINVIICTYNRLEYLRQCVTPLLGVKTDKPFQITIVDNNSTDGTRDYVHSLISSYPFVRYVMEEKQGVSHARNKGWQSSEYEWTLYLDDDSIPPAGLIAEAFSLIDTHPGVHAIGGPMDAVFSEQIRVWLPEGFGDFCLPFDTWTIVDRQYLWGGCLMIKREVFEKLGGFIPALGVVGKTLAYAEEIEIQHRMRQHGMKAAYAPSLRIQHHVRPEKLSPSWILRSEYARRRDKMFFEPIPPVKAIAGLVRTLGSRLIRIPLYSYRLAFQKDYSRQRATLDFFRPLMYRWGEARGSFKNYFRRR
jgi:GT2 family glycosyltransferase